jgi:hypothetical protein
MLKKKVSHWLECVCMRERILRKERVTTKASLRKERWTELQKEYL